jgi:transcriptional regulator with XRE-family HTH domain
MGRQAKPDDPAMSRVREIWDRLRQDGWTQQKLGEAMGYPAASARKSVSQFLRGHDPQIGMVRRFAKAVGVPLEKIIAGKG